MAAWGGKGGEEEGDREGERGEADRDVERKG